MYSNDAAEGITVYVKPIMIDTKNFTDYGYVIAKPQTSAVFENEFVRQWLDIVPFSGFPADTCVSYFEAKRVPIVCTKMESVRCSDEAYISTENSDYILFVADTLNEYIPDEDTIKAFYVPSDISLIVKKGTWHWSPFPVHHDQAFVLMLSRSAYVFSQQRVGVDENKVLFFELQKRYEIC